jgi:hypothetical protein
MVAVAEEPTLNSIPFHAVLMGDLSKSVLDNGGQGGVVQMVVVNLSAEVLLALGLELVVQALTEHSSRGQEECESRGAHDGRFQVVEELEVGVLVD